MEHDVIKVVLEASYPYSDFDGWYNSLNQYEKEVWEHIARDPNKSEHNVELLTKKAMELYCLEMDVDFIPNSEEYLEKIYKIFITNLTLISLERRGMVKLTSGKLSLVGFDDARYELTEKGKEFMKK